MSPQAIRTEPSSAASRKSIEVRLFRSLNIYADPTITKKGCSVRITMELATEVCFKDSIQNKKCRLRNKPANPIVIQSFVLITAPLSDFQRTNGSMRMTEMNNLYIPATEVGVSDDLIIIEETDTARMLMNNSR
ncbi:hypothetical protein D3C73_1064730 [compost metagenome]